MADRAAEAATNLVEYTVSELAFALKRTVEDAYGLVRLRGEISRTIRGTHASGHCYFTLKDEKASHRGGDLEQHVSAPQIQARSRGSRSSSRGRVTTYPDQLQIPDRHRRARARRNRRADGAARAAQAAARRRGPVRRSAQEGAALPAARDRRGDLADGRRDPRHSAQACRPLPLPCAGLAGAGAGRDLRGRGGRRHLGLQRASRTSVDAAARPVDRRARRRQPRRPLGLQRGDRGARGWPQARSR